MVTSHCSTGFALFTAPTTTTTTRCLNLLENLTQTTTFGSSYALITASLRSTNPSSYPNHSYLVDYKDTYLRDLIKDSFGFFFAELSRTGHLLTTSTDHTDPASKQHVFKRQLASAAIKEIFMLMVNLTHANVECTKKLLDDSHLSDQVLIFIHKIAVHLTDSDRFDISVLALIVLINMFVIDWNLFKASDDLSSDPGLKKDKLLKPRSPFLLKEINCRDLEPIDSFEIVLKLYETKEALLSVAETDQENELMQLNEQINSQNVENINMTVMNSIHKAGKHMEHHIIAAMLLAYFLMSRHKLKEAMTYSLTSASSVDRTGKQLLEGFDLARVKSRMKDESFENMIEIIKKFLSFMKIMKVSGFSADEHMEEIIEFLQSS